MKTDGMGSLSQEQLDEGDPIQNQQALKEQ